MKDLTLLSDIPDAENLEQEEFSSTEVQKKITFLIGLICQDIEKGRDKLIKGERIETISVVTTILGVPYVCVKDNYYIDDENGQRLRVNELILKLVVQCFELKGYRLQITSAKRSFWRVIMDEFCSISVRRRKMYVSVNKKTAIVRVDNLNLIEPVGDIFDKALGVGVNPQPGNNAQPERLSLRSLLSIQQFFHRR